MTAHQWVAVLGSAVLALSSTIIVLSVQYRTWKRDAMYRQAWISEHYTGTGVGDYNVAMRDVHRG